MALHSSLHPTWEEALKRAQHQTQYVREGLTTVEFGALAGVHPNTVGKVARKGLKAFQERFGEGCLFEKVQRPNSTQLQWRLTFAGPILPPVEHPPVPGALRAWEFHGRMQLKVTIFSLYHYRWRGHAWFRAKFPGWDFIEVPVPNSEQVICWYAPVEVLGEQADILPEDNLTAVQFAQLKGISSGTYLKKQCRAGGRERFEATYPGWSFRQEGESFIFLRVGSELPQFNMAQFARHRGVSLHAVFNALKHHCFEQQFPGWRAQNFIPAGAAFGRWRITPIASPPVKMSAPAAATRSEPPLDDGVPPWLRALIQSHSGLVQEINGIDRVEFGRLVGRSSSHVVSVIQQGEAVFKATFGAGCAFEKVVSRRCPYDYQFSFLGCVHPTALVIPGLRLVAEKLFAMEQGLFLEEVRRVVAHGSRAVQTAFPGWYWVTLENPFVPGQSVGLFVQQLLEGMWM